MAISTNLRARRSAGQLHALESVEREIRGQDPNGRRKYVQDYMRAFRSYEAILDEPALLAMLRDAQIALIGDYHALPRAQRYAAALFEMCALPGHRPLILGLETVFSRDQHILDEWWRREISAEELRSRIRFDREWGYDWEPFYDLLVVAREHGEAIYALDCMPREDLRKIGARDRHASEKIAEIRRRHPSAAIMVLFGESHLAPRHLPARIRELLPQDRLLTVLQNVDALYWRVSGEQQDHVDAVRVDGDTVCVFNATPLEKYESYRLYLDRWRQEDSAAPDLAPTMYNLIDALSRFLGINRHSSHNGTQPRFLVDLMPEVYGPASFALLRRRIERLAAGELTLDLPLQAPEEAGCLYLPQLNALYAREFHIHDASEAAARFLHAACQGLPRMQEREPELPDRVDSFYRTALEHTFAYFGSRVLYPARAPFHEAELRELYDLTREDLERHSGIPFALATEALDFVCRHRESELRDTAATSVHPALAADLPDHPTSAAAARYLGLLVGCDLYDAYLAGRVTPASVRTLFLTNLETRGAAPAAYSTLARRLRTARRKARAAGAGL